MLNHFPPTVLVLMGIGVLLLAFLFIIFIIERMMRAALRGKRILIGGGMYLQLRDRCAKVLKRQGVIIIYGDPDQNHDLHIRLFQPAKAVDGRLVGIFKPRSNEPLAVFDPVKEDFSILPIRVWDAVGIINTERRRREWQEAHQGNERKRRTWKDAHRELAELGDPKP